MQVIWNKATTANRNILEVKYSDFLTRFGCALYSQNESHTCETSTVASLSFFAFQMFVFAFFEQNPELGIETVYFIDTVVLALQEQDLGYQI